MKRKKTVLMNLAKAINEVTNGDYGMPSVKTPKDDGWEVETLCWDGTYDWTMITCGSSIYSGECGGYSKPTEPKIQKAIDDIIKNGYMLEALNNCQLAVYDF